MSRFRCPAAAGCQRFCPLLPDVWPLNTDQNHFVTTYAKWPSISHVTRYDMGQKITVSETEAALKKMKSGKATGPYDMPADLWKSKDWCPADCLTEFGTEQPRLAILGDLRMVVSQPNSKPPYPCPCCPMLRTDHEQRVSHDAKLVSRSGSFPPIDQRPAVVLAFFDDGPHPIVVVDVDEDGVLRSMTTRFVSISVACNSYTTHYVANVEPFPMTNRSDREGLLRPTDRLQVHQTVSARAGCLLDRKEDLHGSVGPAKCDDDSEKRLHLGGTRLDLETSSVLHLRNMMINRTFNKASDAADTVSRSQKQILVKLACVDGRTTHEAAQKLVSMRTLHEGSIINLYKRKSEIYS
ncbi:unnamed protein product [Heligmosomoides polygyrus]|uniref:Uncharacterized protein n=1 Tax=Heligmosomoides polygyrus TaxID=6339 RepID=A0A3P7YYI7_HELPZ|nr:unnamed protein product [Heligmosomoides polygyrus]